MYERKYRAFHNVSIKSTTVHEPFCASFTGRNPKTKTGTWQEGTRKELEAEAKRLGHKIKDHTNC